jgi:O-antigen/teichoic acid export membrane protein
MISEGSTSSGIQPAYVAGALGIVGVAANIFNSWFLKAKTKKARRTVWALAALVAQAACSIIAVVFASLGQIGLATVFTWAATLILTLVLLLKEDEPSRAMWICFIFVVGMSFFMVSLEMIGKLVNINSSMVEVLEKRLREANQTRNPSGASSNSIPSSPPESQFPR